jgi:hypothetical protein
MTTTWPGVDVMITNFCDFCQFSEKNIGVFLKYQCYGQILAKTSNSWNRKRQTFRQIFFVENIFKIIITSVPGVLKYVHLHQLSMVKSKVWTQSYDRELQRQRFKNLQHHE